MTIDARIVVASVDTYLRFAEATNRLDLYEKGGKGLAEVVDELGGPVIEKVASNVAEGKVDEVLDKTVGTARRVAKKAVDSVTPDRD